MSRHAMVTGAGSGIGEAISRQLHGEGYRVTLVGRRIEPLETLATSLGEGSQAVTGDVTNRPDITASFATAKERYGDIEILVNCAGIAPTAPFHRVDFADWQRTMDVNVNGVFHCTQLALENMLSAGWGRVVNIASVASLRGFPYVSGYCASKHAVLGITRAVALEVATQGITVNAICPGVVGTGMWRGESGLSARWSQEGESEPAAWERLQKSLLPQGVAQTPEDMGQLVVYLAQAEHVTGQAIAVDGGFTL